jgi:hypothetical protein
MLCTGDKRSESKTEPEGEWDVGMRFKGEFHNALPVPAVIRCCNPQTFMALNGQNLCQEREKQTTFISDNLSDS